MSRLLALYPAAWRARYGAELDELLAECGRLSWRVRADVVHQALVERLRAAGLAGDRPPAERMRGGTLVVLCAWALFVVAGTAVQKLSEHWQDAAPSASRGLPTAAFDALVAAAAAGSLLVAAGVVAALPALLAFLRGGGWPSVRSRVRAAAVLTVAAVAGLAGVVLWVGADGSPPRGARAAGALVALLLVACLAAWTAAGVAIARRLELSAATLKVETGLAAGVAGTMTAMTAATATWCGTTPSPVTPALLAATALMLLAAAVGIAGAAHGLRAAAAR